MCGMKTSQVLNKCSGSSSLLSLAQGQCVFKKGNGAHILLQEVNLGRECVYDI